MKIDTDVPIPPKKNGLGRPLSEAGKFVRTMEIGHSVLCDSEEEATNLRRIARGLKFKVTQRKTPEGWRLWRVA